MWREVKQAKNNNHSSYFGDDDNNNNDGHSYNDENDSRMVTGTRTESAKAMELK